MLHLSGGSKARAARRGLRTRFTLPAAVALGCALSGLTARALPLSAQTTGAAQPLAGIFGISAIACPATETCYGVGVGGVVTIASGVASSGQPSSAMLNALACPSTAACYAVGGRAIVPIVRGAAGAAQALASGSSLLNIACADSETCDAVGSILSGSAGVFVQNGLIVPISAGTVGSAQTLAATAGLNEIGFTAIGCASSSTCYAAGRDQFCNERCQLPAVLVIISH